MKPSKSDHQIQRPHLCFCRMRLFEMVAPDADGVSFINTISFHVARPTRFISS
jgi:hypothetical protein